MYKVFDNPEHLAKEFAAEFADIVNHSFLSQPDFTVALSGGSTPRLFFRELSENYSSGIAWEKVKLFWSDERCVSPEDDQSNYKMTKQNLLNFIGIPEENIYRIRGENDPRSEAIRYADKIMNTVSVQDGRPRFDLIILGMGTDGHTASIFPDSPDLIFSQKICEVARNPDTSQWRITFTGSTINRAARVRFLVTGNEKADIVAQILNRTESAKAFPAYFINPLTNDLCWYLDKAAASKI